MAYRYDGGTHARWAFGLSGEPPHPFLRMRPPEGDDDPPPPECTASAIAANNVAKREYQAAYLERWNATAARTATGRPLDAILSPVAPFPAARPGRYRYYGYGGWVNLLDYPACAFPVTTVDRHVDGPERDFRPVSEHDAKVMGDCMIPYSLTPGTWEFADSPSR